jgi:hypothetical protein
MPTIQQKIIVPTWKPICQVDGKPIYAETEPKGKLYLVNGYPMCSLHRLMRLRPIGKLDYRKVFGSRKEEDKAKLDRIVKEEIATQRENQRILEVAAESQAEA